MSEEFEGSERVTLPDGSPEMRIAEAVVSRAMMRASEVWRELLDEDRKALAEQFRAEQRFAYDGLRKMIRKLRDEVTAERLRRELHETPEGKPEDIRVLLVDDDPGTLLAVRRVLESRSMTVFQASGPDEAQKILDEEEIDVVCSDLWIPYNGHRLCEHVRQHHPGCELVIMSGDDGEAMAKAFDMGAFDCLIKPFSIERAILTVTRAAEHRRRGLRR